MKLATSKDLNRLLRQIKAAGAAITKTGPHIKIRLPNGRVVTCSSSPSDHRALLNIKRDLRHAAEH